jgi:hypothetical protein
MCSCRRFEDLSLGVKTPKRFAEKLRGFWGVNPGIDVASWDTMLDLWIERHKNARKSIR